MRQKAVPSGTARNLPKILTAVGLVLLLAFAYLLLYAPQRTQVVVITTDYDPLSMPPNLYATEDRQQWEGLTKENLHVLPNGLKDQQTILKVLDEATKPTKRGGPDGKALVVYLSAHTITDYFEGKPAVFLLGPRASPLQQHPEDWTRLEEVLTRLEKMGGEKNARVILLLDTGRLAIDWSIGVLHQSNSSHIEQLCAKLKLKHVAVIQSCQDGEENWVAPELGGSVFGYYAAQGLCGAADGAGGGRKDRIVSLFELRDYLTNNVSGWVKANRGRVQRPGLCGEKVADFRVAWNSKLPPMVKPPVEQWRSRLADLAEAWSTYDQLYQQDTLHHRPVAWGSYEQQLVRLQDLAFGGPSSSGDFENVKQACQRAAEQLREALPNSASPSLVSSLRLSYQGDALATFAAEVPAANPGKGKDVKPAAAKPPEVPLADRQQFEQKLLLVDFRRASPKEPQEIFSVDGALAFGNSNNGIGQWLALVASATANQRRLNDVLARWPADATIERRFVQLLATGIDWKDEAGQKNLMEETVKALRARHLAELASSPLDVRARKSIQALVGRGDTTRREVEDRLLIGDPTRLSSAAGDLTALVSAAGPYWQAVQDGELLSRAWRKRDEVFAGFPWLAQWYARARSRGLVNEAGFEELRAALTKLNLHLELPHDIGDPAIRQRFRDEVAQLDAAWDKVRVRFGTLFDTELASRKSYDRGDSVGDALIALRVPKMGATKRQDVMTKLLDRMSAPVAPAADAAKAPAPKGAFGGWKTHPATWVAMYDSGLDLSVDKDKPVNPAALLKEGSRLRERLSTLPAKLTASVEAANAKFTENDAQARTGAIQEDSRGRAIAALSGMTETRVGQEPARLVYNMELAEWYDWQATRAIADFWARRNSAGDHFFEETARNCLQLAEDRGGSAAIKRHEGLRKHLAAASTAATMVPLPRAKDLGIIPDADAPDEQVNYQLAWKSAATEGWPVGEAALWMQRKSGDLIPLEIEGSAWRRFGVPSQTSVNVDSRLRLNDLLERGERGQAAEVQALFRGHQWRSPFGVVEGRFQPLIQLREEPSNPSIKVQGMSKRVVQLLLILDCSASMDELVSEEGGQKKRFLVASEALTALLVRLDKSVFDVALMAYGHRAGVTKTGKLTFLNPPGPPGIDTSNDVEMLVNFGKGKEAILEKLPGPNTPAEQALRPFGRTPLYLSLVRALDALKGTRASGPRRIVLLTDGLNFSEGTNPTSADEVTRKWAETPEVQIDIVGMDIKATSAQEKAQLEQLKKINNGRGKDVAFQFANNAVGLRDALLRTARFVQFEVDQEGQRLGAMQDLNSLWTRDDWKPSQSPKYTVRLQGEGANLGETQVLLEGGEALEIELDEAGRPRHPRWQGRGDENGTYFQKDQGSLRVGIHLAERDVDVYRFYVSAQNKTEGEFSSRPKSIWIELRPDPPDGTVFTFFEPFFQNRVPVPLLKCEVPIKVWPSDARRAELQVWFRPEAIPPEKTWRLEEMPVGNPMPLDAVGNIQIERVRDRIDGDWRVIELREHHGDASTLNQIGLMLDPPPDELQRATFPELNKVKHVARFKRSRLENAQLQVQIVSKTSISKDLPAVKTAVNVPGN